MFFALCSALLLLSPSPARAEPSHPPEAATDADAAPATAADQLASVLTFTPEQVAAAESALNSTASAVFAAYNRTKAAKAAFFQDAIATPFGQLKAGGLRAGGLVKRTNRTEKSDWLTSELALAPFARAFSQVSAAVESSPVGKAFAAARPAPSDAAAAAAAASTESDGKFTLLPPSPRQVLARVGSELRLPGGGPAEDVAAAIAGVEKGAEDANAAAASKAAAETP